MVTSVRARVSYGTAGSQWTNTLTTNCTGPITVQIRNVWTSNPVLVILEQNVYHFPEPFLGKTRWVPPKHWKWYDFMRTYKPYTSQLYKNPVMLYNDLVVVCNAQSQRQHARIKRKQFLQKLRRW